MRHYLKGLPAVAALFLLAPPANCDILSFTVETPGLHGFPGSTTGWGFTVVNDTGWAAITNSEFCEGSQTPPCTHALGTYLDFIAGNFTVVGPGATLSQSFDGTAPAGVGEFTFTTTPLFTTAFGELILTYDVYTVDPNGPLFNPYDDTQIVSTGNTISAAVSVSQVPEPSSFAMTLGAVALAAMGERWRTRRRSLAPVRRVR